MSYFLLEKNTWKNECDCLRFSFYSFYYKKLQLDSRTELLHNFRKDYVQNGKSSSYSNNNS